MVVDAEFAGRIALEAHGITGSPIAANSHGEHGHGANADVIGEAAPDSDKAIPLYIEVLPN